MNKISTIAILASIIIHLIIISSFGYLNKLSKNNSVTKLENKKSKIQISFIRSIKQSKVKSKNNIKRIPKIKSLSELGYKYSSSNKILKRGVFGDRLNSIQPGSIYSEIYSKINQHLNYPKELINHNIKGIVNVRLSFSSSGNYLESQTQILSYSKYLKVHVARVLRKAFKYKVKLKSKRNINTLDSIFKFNLTTGIAKSNSSKALYFIRTAYGGNSPIDKINKGVNNIISHASNWLLFLQYRPDFLKTDKELMRKEFNKSILRNYKNDPAWGS